MLKAGGPGMQNHMKRDVHEKVGCQVSRAVHVCAFELRFLKPQRIILFRSSSEVY